MGQSTGLARGRPKRYPRLVTTTVQAIYENGKIVLPNALPLPDKSRVLVTIESDGERASWSKVSEEALAKTWNNSDDDVFNELLTK